MACNLEVPYCVVNHPHPEATFALREHLNAADELLEDDGTLAVGERVRQHQQDRERQRRRPDWDSYFLNIAVAVAARADCTRRKVGAVIVDADHRIIATGYNGAAAGAPGCLSDGACPRGQLSLDELPAYGSYDNCIAVHAEANALLHADGRHTRGATLYITDKPCSGCERLIEGAGIIRVVHP